jgi:hypothetical protein
MGRSNLKCSPETVEQLADHKRDGETWDGLLRRAAGALEGEQPIEELRNGTAYLDVDGGTKEEGRVEIYGDWVRLPGLNAAWIPREKVEQIHEF